jgi:integrase/recombinase XerD
VGTTTTLSNRSEESQQELVERFIQERIYLKNLTPKTIEYYRDSFHAFDGAMESKATVGERITKLRNRGVSPISVNSYLRAVNAFFRWAHIEGHLPELTHIPKLKEPQQVLATLSAEQVQRVIQFKPHGKNQHRIHAIACLLLDTGMRIDEALSLRREHVDMDNLLVRVHGKGRKDRVIPMSLEMRKVMWKWTRRGDERSTSAARVTDLVFSTATGLKPEYRNMLRDFKIVGRKLHIEGVRFSFHTLRHTFAVNYIRNGGDVFRLQRVLGHSTLEMTRRYVNLQTSDLQAVHERLSLLARAGR